MLIIEKQKLVDLGNNGCAGLSSSSHGFVGHWLFCLLHLRSGQTESNCGSTCDKEVRCQSNAVRNHKSTFSRMCFTCFGLKPWISTRLAATTTTTTTTTTWNAGSTGFTRCIAECETIKELFQTLYLRSRKLITNPHKSRKSTPGNRTLILNHHDFLLVQKISSDTRDWSTKGLKDLTRKQVMKETDSLLSFQTKLKNWDKNIQPHVKKIHKKTTQAPYRTCRSAAAQAADHQAPPCQDHLDQADVWRHSRIELLLGKPKFIVRTCWGCCVFEVKR